MPSAIGLLDKAFFSRRTDHYEGLPGIAVQIFTENRDLKGEESRSTLGGRE